MKQTKTFKEGDEVRYIPIHANGDINHKDCENGIVYRVSTDSKIIFVRYWRNGMLQQTPKGTNPEDLILTSYNRETLKLLT